MKRRSLLLKVPRDALSGKKRRRGNSDLHCDYLKRHNRPANRRRTDPVVVLSTILENILNELRDMPDVQPFLFPVNSKVTISPFSFKKFRFFGNPFVLSIFITFGRMVWPFFFFSVGDWLLQHNPEADGLANDPWKFEAEEVSESWGIFGRHKSNCGKLFGLQR